jgi:predicted DNA repair protein MutK
MAITLSTVSSSPVWLQSMVLAFSGLGMTVLVYGAVAIIVKADDFGAHLALKGSAMLRALGRAIVFGMPIFLQILSQVGMLAMLWVGGGILVHGLHVLGVHGPEDWINGVGDYVVSFAGGVGSWFVKASISALIGLVVGIVVDPISTKILLPTLVIFKRLLPIKN